MKYRQKEKICVSLQSSMIFNIHSDDWEISINTQAPAEQGGPYTISVHGFYCPKRTLAFSIWREWGWRIGVRFGFQYLSLVGSHQKALLNQKFLWSSSLRLIILVKPTNCLYYTLTATHWLFRYCCMMEITLTPELHCYCTHNFRKLGTSGRPDRNNELLDMPCDNWFCSKLKQHNLAFRCNNEYLHLLICKERKLSCMTYIYQWYVEWIYDELM